MTVVLQMASNVLHVLPLYYRTCGSRHVVHGGGPPARFENFSISNDTSPCEVPRRSDRK